MKSKKKIPKTFISFLLASVLIWLLITLSKEYTATISFPIEYTNISQNKLLQSTPIKELKVVVKTNGFKILRTRVNTKKVFVNANSLLKKKGTTHYLLIKKQKQRIQEQLPSGLELKEIIKDTLFLDVGSLVTRKLALKPNVKIKYHVGYDLSEQISVTPDSILVSGPENYISELKNLELLPLELEDVKTDFSQKGTIKIPKGVKNLKFETKEIIISGKVEKFTEGTLNVRYNIINVPEGLEINTLSKEVEVTFIVGLSGFNNITKDSFKIECDYNMAATNNLGYLIPKMVNKPNEIKSFKITPNKIDFLIQN